MQGQRRSVVVTGLGAVCGLGLSFQDIWGKLIAGRSGVREITHFEEFDFDK